MRSCYRVQKLFNSTVYLFTFQRVLGMVAAYLTRFSELEHDMINCGPVLSWLEVSYGNCAACMVYC